ncbi:hypothetical protein NCZ19_25600, partial [Bacteroides thetaiotaomicron]|nr:hypothetical protein [Bacteroides thetaiotaomicron]MCM1663442.1 hypothetical protein [Bacteroides thetaiotaomicron]MCM1699740.1 hypothetical protein [Bacteroides thetaiotaomicron]MCM1713165.1 hypothetical protein [Bacteroides thetaiotaomicron]MCM1795574.1 hypothetical protein [Bacteroides thetaiotaomicron]
MAAIGDGNVTANVAITLQSHFPSPVIRQCSVLNKLTLQKSKIKMKYSKKQYNYYSDDERMSYIREYLSSP